MTATKTDKPLTSTGYDLTKKLIEQTGKSGLLGPLMSVLSTLVDDPLLKKTLEENPIQLHQKKTN